MHVNSLATMKFPVPEMELDPVIVTFEVPAVVTVPIQISRPIVNGDVNPNLPPSFVHAPVRPEPLEGQPPPDTVATVMLLLPIVVNRASPFPTVDGDTERVVFPVAEDDQTVVFGEEIVAGTSGIRKA